MERMDFEFRERDVDKIYSGISVIPEIFKTIEGSKEIGLVGDRDSDGATYHVLDATVVVRAPNRTGGNGTVYVASRNERSLTRAVAFLEGVLGEKYTLAKATRKFE